MQRRKPVFIGELLKRAIADNAVLSKGMRESDIVNSWREIAGEKIFESTSRMYIRNQQLYVEFSSAVARKEFYNNRHTILRRINEVAGRQVIKFIYVI